MFNHVGTSVISAMRDLTFGVFEYLKITSVMDVDVSIKYMDRILRLPALNKYQQVLVECKQFLKALYGYQCSLWLAKGVSMEQFQAWENVDTIDRSGGPISGLGQCTYFEKDFWFELVNCMWSKHHRVFQYHLKYIHNDIVNPSHVGILRYAGHVQDMHDLEKHLTPHLMKGKSFEGASWKVHCK